MSVRIVTDSTADFTVEEMKSYNISVVPLKVLFGTEEYRDGIDLTADQFYHKLTTGGVLPTTSQPSPNDFLHYFKQAKEEKDEVVAILLSAAISGTCQSALLAKEYCEYEAIEVVDSQQTTISMKLLVLEAIRLRDAGKGYKEIATEIERLKEKVTLKASLDTLEYLVKGGRLSKAAGFAGSLLGIRPLISLVEGKVAVLSKARGKKNAVEAILKEINKDGDVDFNRPMIYGFTGDAQSVTDLRDFLQEKGYKSDLISVIGSVIGTHAGPGASAIAYFKK